MATMKRNQNLEEISSGSILEDIELLKGQTAKQKGIFFGGVILGMSFTMWGTFFANIDLTLMVFIALVPIFIGVIFGCNYNEDVTLLRYIKISLFDANQVLYSKPKESISYLKSSSEKIKKDDTTINEDDFEEHFRKRIKRVGIVIGVIIVAVIILLFVNRTPQNDEIHHTVSAIDYLKDII